MRVGRTEMFESKFGLRRTIGFFLGYIETMLMQKTISHLTTEHCLPG